MNRYEVVPRSVTELMAQQRQQGSQWDPAAHSGSDLGVMAHIEARLRFVTAALGQRLGLTRRLVYANLQLAWFNEFQHYWREELGMRRIHPIDFYHLRGVLRQKFQDVAVPSGVNSQDFLSVWQQPETLYSLFQYVYKLALSPVVAWRILKHIPRGAAVCEFGCGLAPVTDNLCRYFPYRKVSITVADIPTYMLHFVGWKYRAVPFVRVVDIDPVSDSPLSGSFDVITCLTVFEHLPRPLAIAQHFHQVLREGGLLIFDYRASEGTGLDTKEASEEREQVLRFIEQHFTVVEGVIDAEQEHFGTVVYRKR